MTNGALIKIDHLIEEADSTNLFDLSTNSRRALAAKIQGLTEKEKDKLGLISHRLMIGVKNGAIDTALAATILGLGTAAAVGTGPLAAVVAAIGGVAAGAVGFKKAKKDAFMANDMNTTMGKKQIDKLVKELEGLIGKPLVKLIKLEGKVRL